MVEITTLEAGTAGLSTVAPDQAVASEPVAEELKW
jgi:hypothetical protein